MEPASYIILTWVQSDSASSILVSYQFRVVQRCWTCLNPCLADGTCLIHYLDIHVSSVWFSAFDPSRTPISKGEMGFHISFTWVQRCSTLPNLLESLFDRGHLADTLLYHEFRVIQCSWTFWLAEENGITWHEFRVNSTVFPSPQLQWSWWLLAAWSGIAHLRSWVSWSVSYLHSTSSDCLPFWQHTCWYAAVFPNKHGNIVV